MPVVTAVATVVATAEPSTPLTITLPDASGQIALPAGLVATTTIFTYSEFITPTETTGGLSFAGASFTLEATDVYGQPVTSFADRFTITLNYQDTDWQTAGISDENSLNLYYWNGIAWIAILPCDGCSLDTVNNRIVVELNHLTEFALLGNPLAVPEVNAYKTSGGVELRWTQAGSNVVRYAVYRSVKPYFAPGEVDVIKLDDVVAPGAGLQVSWVDPGPFTAPSAIITWSWLLTRTI